MSALSDALKSNSSITHLDLSHNRCVWVLACSCGICRFIGALFFCRIGGKGAIILSKALERTEAMIDVRLSNNPLGQRGARALMKALLRVSGMSKNRNRGFDLSNCDLETDEPDAFDWSNPGGRMLHDGLCMVLAHLCDVQGTILWI